MEKIKELFGLHKSKAVEFCKQNKSILSKEKKLVPKKSDSIIFTPKAIAAKSSDNGIFKIVGNSVGFFDSHHDVSLKGSFNRTVKQGAKYAPFLRDHCHSLEGIVGYNKGVSVEMIDIRALGYNKDGQTECFVMKAEPVKKYNEKVYNLYHDGQVKQHSIGLRYIDLVLAIEGDNEEEGENWNKYISQVINVDECVKHGYFWGIKEQSVVELSGVIFGSNAYTPTLEDKHQPFAAQTGKSSGIFKYLNY